MNFRVMIFRHKELLTISTYLLITTERSEFYQEYKISYLLHKNYFTDLKVQEKNISTDYS